jgi:MerR family copper efflux transcriptional regulator
MNIGQAAKASGISAKMIRYYEATGLIPPVTRSAAGYRHYSDSDIHTLSFIRRARDLGFSVEQIADLLALWRNRRRSSASVKAVALAQIAMLKTKADELRAMARTLQHLADHCHGDNRPDCPIIEDLAGPATARCSTCQPQPRRQSTRFGEAGGPRAAQPDRRRQARS